MKLKYYLRGLGIGIICTAIIMGIALSGNKKETLTDAEIIERARLLGMVMEEEEAKEPDDAKDAKQDSEDGQKLEDGQEQPDDQKSEDGQKPDDKAEEEEAKEPENDKTADQSSEQEPDETADQNSGQEPQEMVEIEIVKGDYSDVISQKLFQAGLIPDADAFNAYLTQKGVDSTLRVGVHQIPKGATPDEIIKILQEKP